MSDRLKAIRGLADKQRADRYAVATVMLTDLDYLLSIAEAAEAYRDAVRAYYADNSNENGDAAESAESRLFAALDGKEPTNA